MTVEKYELLLDKEKGISYLEVSDLFEYESTTSIFNSPESVCNLMDSVFKLSEKAEEHVYMLAFNSRCRLLGVFEISHGVVNYSLLRPREVFLRALLISASTIIVVHNHPSLDTKPSRDDIQVTRCLEEIGSLLGLPLQDHIIIGNNYYSFKQAGLLK